MKANREKTAVELKKLSEEVVAKVEKKLIGLRFQLAEQFSKDSTGKIDEEKIAILTSNIKLFDTAVKNAVEKIKVLRIPIQISDVKKVFEDFAVVTRQVKENIQHNRTYGNVVADVTSTVINFLVKIASFNIVPRFLPKTTDTLDDSVQEVKKFQKHAFKLVTEVIKEEVVLSNEEPERMSKKLSPGQ